jgi:AcrR family transcriptional regulator
MPADSSATRERILATAERLFAEHGYDGISLRTIATEAKAHLALIRYHFGSKEDLYRAIWAGRYVGPAEWRAKMFAEMDYSIPREKLLQRLVDIFLSPIGNLMADPSGRAFLQIVAHEMGDSKEVHRGVLRDYLDPPGRDVIAAFRRALPEAPLREIAWGFQMMAGATMLHMVDVDRTTRLSEGAARSGDFQAALPRMRAFIVGGWLEIARRCRSTLPDTSVLAPQADVDSQVVCIVHDRTPAIAKRTEQLQARKKARGSSTRMRRRAVGPCPRS